MISKKEIQEKAIEKGVSGDIIDKDWVLSHVLKGIFEMPALKENLIFKGGTCLKKCFFPDYRFSEDLDFTLTKENLLIDEKMLLELCEDIFKQSGILLKEPKIESQRFNEKFVGYKVKLKYWGANHSKNKEPTDPKRWTTSIKIDANWYEKMIFPTIKQGIEHNYSDSDFFEGFRLTTYSIEEVLSEKLRALIQRSYCAARDYFDIWAINNRVPNLNWNKITQGFQRKCEYKGIIFEGVGQILNDDVKIKLAGQWENQLKNQLNSNDYKSLEIVYEDLEVLFNKIFEK